MPVGNDVVDLHDPDNQPTAIHPRFDERVFSRPELRWLDELDGVGRHLLRWTLWAARESAYKCLAQQQPGLPFRPAEMAVRLEGPLPGCRAGRVEWRDRGIDVQADCRTDRVHVVTLSADGTTPASRLRRLADSNGTGVGRDPYAISAATRALAGRTVARLLGLEAANVRIATTEPGSPGSAPRALYAGRVLPVELSLSHDGAWIACAVLNRRTGPAAAR